MKIIKDKVNFNRVYFNFLKEHIGSRGFLSANTQIKAANGESTKWQLVELDLEEICNKLLLVNHRHPCQGLELINATGMTIPAALKNFHHLGDEYHSHNEECYRQIMVKSQTGFSTIFLSKNPVMSIPEHRTLRSESDNLIHLDGLHRLIGWAHAGKFSDTYSASPTKLTAFIADN